MTPEYKKIIPKTEREKKLNYIKKNLNTNNKYSKGNINLTKITEPNEHKKISDSCSPPNKNIYDKNNPQNISYLKYFRDSYINKGLKSNNFLYYTSHNYNHHPIKKIQNFDSIENVNKTKTFHQKVFK